ncbi:50S ribosomal protein L3 [archaeon]|nr:50S ribosomal protein L3 [archaeon]
MATKSKPHAGSLQYWPRTRAAKIIPSVNWKPISKESGLQGFIGYKAGMISVYVKDDTSDSLTKGKRIIVPGTVIECPVMKIYSVRLYKNGQVLKDIVVSNEKELKRVIKVSKEVKKLEDMGADFDDLRVIVYSDVKSTAIKKTPDLIELAISGTKDDKIKYVTEKVGKEISISEVFPAGLVDVRGVTKGYGTEGPVQRFGISLKSHKSEKGVRRPGSLGAFGMRRVMFRTPQAGQTGYFSRVAYNNLVLKVGKISEDNINRSSGFHKFGNLKTEFIVLKGSVPGVPKRPLLMTAPLRPTKYTSKKKLEVIEFR